MFIKITVVGSGEGFYFGGGYPGFFYSFGVGDFSVRFAGVSFSGSRVNPHVHTVLRET